MIYFIIGLIFGSFYNVCIYRLPIGKSIVAPRSSCGNCHHELGALDMIPVFSYLFSKGRCRYCKEKYSIRYPMVELLTGILFYISYLVFGHSYLNIFGLILTSVLIIITFIDIDHQIILDRFSIIIIIMAVAYHFIYKDITVLNALFGFVLGGGLLMILAFFGAMGGGDVKIMASVGLLLGFPKILMALYLAFIVGALVLAPIAMYQKIKYKEYKSVVPFGPFLCIGTYITFYFSNELYMYYLMIFA